MASLLQQPVCEAVDTLLVGKDRIKVLEAGCGSARQIHFNAETFVVGIDISAEELEKNRDVQEKLHGDIQEYPLPKEEFDVVVCWMVLEHLSRPKDALKNMFRTTKPGGIVILGIPNLGSIKGMVTKFTPFWFHKAFYRYMRYTSRHFPTYLRADILPNRLIRFAERNGFSVAFCRLVEGNVPKKLRNRSRIVDLAFLAVDAALRIVSLGMWQTSLLDECAIVLKRSSGPGAAAPVYGRRS
jgi:ubiquinone/menaquinone biosynthesis C-methylase UbiE